jgi:hypothetical protein
MAAGLAVVLWLAACGQPPGSSPSTTSVPAADRGVAVNPARIDRVRLELPADYEVADISGLAAPAALWGFGARWIADPAPCATLADPVANGSTPRGWSGSGSGGIVHAVVSEAAAFDPAVLDQCAQWTLSAGHTSGIVTLLAAPAIADAATVGMATAATTDVEGGTETRSHADTFIAYLGEYVSFVTVVTDPGSPNPPLGPEFAAGLLVEAVAALRG